MSAKIKSHFCWDILWYKNEIRRNIGVVCFRETRRTITQQKEDLWYVLELFWCLFYFCPRAVCVLTTDYYQNITDKTTTYLKCQVWRSMLWKVYFVISPMKHALYFIALLYYVCFYSGTWKNFKPTINLSPCIFNMNAIFVDRTGPPA
jgi:hypothetical protein